MTASRTSQTGAGSKALPFIGGGADLGGGNDIFTNFKKVGGVIKHGIVTGIIDLGVGDDIFRGGKRAEKVRDDEGTDSYSFGGGNDTYFAVYVSSSPSGDGADIVNGGAGIRTSITQPNARQQWLHHGQSR